MLAKAVFLSTALAATLGFAQPSAVPGTAPVPAIVPAANPLDPYARPTRNLAPYSGWNLYIEEDLLFPPANEDRNYTGGLGFNIHGDWIDRWKLTWPLEKLDRFLFAGTLSEGAGRMVYSAMLGLTAFTPDSLNTREVVRNDRPYSSLIFLNTGRLSVMENSNLAIQSGLSIGVLGLDAAKGAQTWIHEVNRNWTGKETPFEPLGWHHQISDGGEPTLLYSLAFNYKVLALPNVPEAMNRTGTNSLQWTVKAEANAGYFTNLAFGSTLRLGMIRTRFWQFNSSPMTGFQQAIPETKSSGPKPSSLYWECYLFGGLRYRVVGYNALLQGQFRESDYTIDGEQLNRTLNEFDFGLSASLWRFNMNYLVFSGRTAEFNGPRARTHTWGSFFLSYQAPLAIRGR